MVDTNVRETALGAELQQNQNGLFRVKPYASHVSVPEEQNYCTNRTELSGIMIGLQSFRSHFWVKRFHSEWTRQR